MFIIFIFNNINGFHFRIHAFAVSRGGEGITQHVITSPPIGGGRGIVMPMSVCLFVCVCLSVRVCPCFRKISKCNISVISQPIIMKLNIHIEYGYSVKFRSKVKVVGHRNVFP